MVTDLIERIARQGVKYFIITPVSISINLLLAPINLIIWAVTIYLNAVSYVIFAILNPKKTSLKFLKNIGLDLKSRRYTSDSQENAPGSISGTGSNDIPMNPEDLESKKQYRWMQGYAIVIDSFDEQDSPGFKPSIIPSLLKRPFSKKVGGNAASKKKRLQRENFYYLKLVAEEGELKLYPPCISEESEKQTNSPIMNPQYSIAIKGCKVSLYRSQKIKSRPMNRMYPIELSNLPGESKVKFLFLPTSIEKEIWFYVLLNCVGLLDRDSLIPSKRQNMISYFSTIFLDDDKRSSQVDLMEKQHKPITPSRGKFFRFRAPKQLPETKDHTIPSRHIKTVSTEWLNLLLSRLWLTLMDSKKLHLMVENKIISQISKIKAPGMVKRISLRKVILSHGVPMLDNAIVSSYSEFGDIRVFIDLTYKGNFSLEIATEAQLDSGGRMPKITILWKVSVKELSGKLLLKTNPFPSNRLWWGFEKMPKYILTVEPLLGETNLGFNAIKELIERRLGDIISDSFVLPNMDDISFFEDDHVIDTNMDLESNQTQDSSFVSPTLDDAIEQSDEDESDTSSIYSQGHHSDTNSTSRGFYGSNSSSLERVIDHFKSSSVETVQEKSPVTYVQNSGSLSTLDFNLSRGNVKEAIINRLSPTKTKWFSREKKQASQKSM